MDYTPTQRKMLAILADGLPHTREELHAVLVDEQGPLKNIRPHLCSLRRKLRPQGQDIVCELRGGIFYRQIRLLKTPNISQSAQV